MLTQQQKFDILTQDLFQDRDGHFVKIRTTGRLGWEDLLPEDGAYSSMILSPKDDEDLLKNAVRIARQVLVSMNPGRPLRLFVHPDTSMTNGHKVWVATKVLDEQRLSVGKRLDTFLGFTVHEGSHVLYTDFDAFGAIRNRLVGDLQNIIEDERIERLLGEDKPGLANYLKAAKYYAFDQYINQTDQPGLNELCRLLNCILMYVRYPASLNKDDVMEFADELMKVKEILTPYPENTEGSIRAAEAIYEVLRRFIPKSQAGGKDDQGEAESRKSSSKDKSEEGERRSSSASGSDEDAESEPRNGSSGSDDDNNEQEGSGADDDDKDKDDEREGSGSGEGEDNEGESGSRIGNDTDEEDSDGNDNKDNPDNPDNNDTADNSDNSDNKENKNNKDNKGNKEENGTESSGEDNSSSSDPSDGDGSGNEADDDDDDDEQEGSGEGEDNEGDQEGLPEREPMTDEELMDALEDLLDALKALSGNEKCQDEQDMSQAAAKDDGLLAKELDGLLERGKDHNNVFIEALSDKASYLSSLSRVSRFIPAIRRALTDNDFTADYTLLGMRSGRLDTNKLAEARQSVQTIYTRTVKAQPRPMNVVLLIDESGSMHHRCILCRDAAVLIQEAVENIPDIRLSVYGYTSGNPKNVLITHKDHWDKHPDKYRIGSISAYGSTPTREAIMEITARITERSGDRTILFVLSDGVPDSTHQAVRNAVDEATRKGITVIGISVASSLTENDLKAMYGHYLVMNDNADLPKELGKTIKKAIIKAH